MTEPTDAAPAPGTRWIHRNGAPYTVLMIANSDTEDEARYPVTVVYQGDNGKVWSRPASDWHRSMTATTPQPTQAQAGAVPLTPEQVADIADAAHRGYDRLVASGKCAPRWSAVFAHLLEQHHGIKGGQHGAD